MFISFFTVPFQCWKKRSEFTHIYIYLYIFYISIHKTEAYFVAGLEQNDYARCTAINNLSYRFLTMNDAFFFHIFSSLSLPLFQWFERLARKNVAINAIWFFFSVRPFRRFIFFLSHLCTAFGVYGKALRARPIISKKQRPLSVTNRSVNRA